ncbi:MAG: hypothetical protein QXN67_07700 [Thermoproteota archaeon]
MLPESIGEESFSLSPPVSIIDFKSIRFKRIGVSTSTEESKTG